MKGFFAGIMAFFTGVGTFLHGGQPATQQPTDTSVQTAPGENAERGNRFPGGAISGTPMARPSGAPEGKNMRMIMGIVSAVSSTTVTIDDPRNASTTITLSDDTTYTNGDISDVVKGVRIAVKLKATTDNSRIAESVEINPVVPSGAPNKPPGQQPAQ